MLTSDTLIDGRYPYRQRTRYLDAGSDNSNESFAAVATYADSLN